MMEKPAVLWTLTAVVAYCLFGAALGDYTGEDYTSDCLDRYIASTVNCPLGTGPANLYGCSPIFEKTAVCLACTSDTYKSTLNQNSCTACPDGTTTNGSTGATALSDCYSTSCDANEYMNGGSCQSCPDYTTSPAGSDSSSDCVYTTCEAGLYRNGSSCYSCAANTYSSTSSTSTICTSCPYGNTNGVTGSTSSSACGCDAGDYINDSTCSSCPESTYKASWSTDTSCTECAMYKNTRGETGSDSSSDCVYVTCGIGQYRSGSTCLDCAVNTYSSVTSTDTTCTSCDTDKSTEGDIGSDSSSDCVYISCDVGYYRGGSSCYPCAANTYSSTSSTSTSCTSCPYGNTNGVTGSTSSSACGCDAGEFVDSGFCSACIEDTYKASWSADTSCTDCGISLTSGPGSKSISDCEAAAGYFVNDSGDAEACEIGSYRAGTAFATSCTECTGGRTTAGTAAASESECVCGPGYAFSAGSCEKCIVGTWKSTSSDSDSCTSCGSGLSSVEGSTSIDACEAPAGHFVNDNEEAEACEADTFRTGSGRVFSCDSCPGDRSTFGATTSTLETDCICDIGHKLSTDGYNSCDKCDVGTFNNAQGLETSCTTCGFKRSTDGEGSTSLVDCVCVAGWKETTAGATCSECDLNTFKATLGDLSTLCESCGANLVTEDVGAVAENECLAPNGFMYNSTTLVGDECPSKWYRSTGNSRTLGCIQCSGGRTTGGETASESEDACGCVFGEGWDGESACEECSGVEFSDVFGMTGCSSCPAGATTEGSDAAVDSSDCKCASGLEWESGVTGSSCVACADGFFSPGWGDSACSSCPTGSSHSADYSTCECSPGYTVDLDSEEFACVVCSEDTYKDFQGDDKCLSCESFMVASTTNGSDTSTSRTQCQCPGGFQLDSFTSTCEKCPMGLFKAAWGDSTVCIETSDGFVPSSDRVSEVSCSPGFYAPSLSEMNSSASVMECMACPDNQSSPSTSTAGQCFTCPGLSVRNEDGICECPAGAGGADCEACVVFSDQIVFWNSTHSSIARNTTFTSEAATFTGAEGDVDFPICKACALDFGTLDGIVCLEEDCKGTPGGDMVEDACGLCGGDSNTCDPSSSVLSTLTISDPTSTAGVTVYSGFTLLIVVLTALIICRRRRNRVRKPTVNNTGSDRGLTLGEYELDLERVAPKGEFANSTVQLSNHFTTESIDSAPCETQHVTETAMGTDW